MRYFCTYFDHRFLPRALAMIESLRRWCPELRVWALCMDDASYRTLCGLRIPGVQAISLEELERSDPELRAARDNRSRLEYFFTCTPALPLHVFRRCPEVDLLTYLDADLYFYDSPEPLFDELGGGSVGIIPHRFSRRVTDRARFGTYNVGWISFRRDPDGLACLRWWREQCLEWCFARVEGDRYADQKYLDQWPERFENVRVLQHKGANLGPWNLASYSITEQGGRVWVDDQRLLFFHFSSFQRVAPWLYNTNLSSWHVRPFAVVRRRIVGPYISALEKLHLPGGSPAPEPAVCRPVEGRGAWLARKLRALGRILGGLVAQDHLVVLRGRVL
jgi:hypothetical protein